MKPFGILTWKWLARRLIGRPSLPWLGRGGQMKSTGGTTGGSPTAGGNGREGGGTVIRKDAL